MSEPLVSVVIAAYNASEYLPETLESVLAQTYPRVEIIIVDDGSTDDTPARIAPFRPRIRLIRRAHGGLAAARNAGIREATGEYVALLDADDLWLPEKLATQVECATRHPEAGLIACDGTWFGSRDSDSNLAGHQAAGPAQGRLFSPAVAGLVDQSPSGEVTLDLHSLLVERNCIGCPAQTLIPRRVIESLGPFEDSAAQDYDYYLRIAKDLPVTLQRAALVRYRLHPGSMSGPGYRAECVWGIATLGVLRRHARRCGPADRNVAAAHADRIARDLGYHIYTNAVRLGRRESTVFLARLLRERPWPPAAVGYLAALWMPAFLRQRVIKVRKALRSRVGNPGAARPLVKR